MTPPPIDTPRLRLVPQTLADVRAAIEAMEPSQRAEVSPVWLARLESGTADPWSLGFDVRNRSTSSVVGACGFKGPPDDEGVVEIAYAIAPEHQNQGYATEVAAGLTTFAWHDDRVRFVRAHTLPEPNASTHVLTKCGFEKTGDVVDPEDGPVWRWERARNEDLATNERIERASLRAWPAIEESPLERWSMRFSEGFTGRANSVQTAAGSKSPIDARIDRSEAWYDARGRPCLFRLTPLSERGADPALHARGYERAETTDVLSIPAAELDRPSGYARLQSVSLPEWLGTFTRLHARPGWPPRALGEIVSRILPPRLHAVLADADGRAVACGLAVHDYDLVGIFDVVVTPDLRRSGYGAELVHHLASWAVERGADRVYLQVAGSNTAARGLYRKLGFRPAYPYWYRRPASRPASAR